MTTETLDKKTPLISLLDRIREYIGACMYSNNELPTDIIKFRGGLLLAEVYSELYIVHANRQKNIGAYFDNNALHNNLEYIIAIEKLQQRISEFYPYRSENNDKNVTEGIRNLYNNGISVVFPNVKDSKIWKAERDRQHEDENRPYLYGRVFREAHESLDDETSKYYAFETQYDGLVGPPNLIQYILDFQSSLQNTSIDSIRDELVRGLELLRLVYMAEAEYILQVRVNGCDKRILKDYDKKRKTIQEDIREYDLKEKLENWRFQKPEERTGRTLLQGEYINFLNEWKSEILSTMQSDYPDLWKIRAYSGGLDANVTTDSFARMFFKRGNTSNDFLRLQWTLEVIDETIAKEEQKDLDQHVNYSPEEDAVNQFEENIYKVVGLLVQKFEGKTVSKGAHKAEVTIHIKQKELKEFVADQRKNNYDNFKDICYPQDGKYKMKFCKYIIFLRDKKEQFFGEIPKKYLVEAIAPVIKISKGCAQNYLSK